MCGCESAPSNQSAHTRQGCGSLRRRVQSECRVLARLEASPVTGLLGMERKRQGSTLLALVLAHPGVAGLWPGVQACHSRRARLARGGKVHFVIRCFKTRLRRHPSHASWPPTHPPRCWVCHGPGTYGHGVTHATVTHSASLASCLLWAILGSRLTSQSHGHDGPAADDTPPSPRPVRLHRSVAAGIPPGRQG